MNNTKDLYDQRDCAQPARDTDPQTNIEDKYHMERMIGNGSFGVVHEAIHRETGRRVAIKKVLQASKPKSNFYSLYRTHAIKIEN